ncbi:MAG: MmcQ/YjbR family DNA-binding protein [Candidatus Acidiferrales bacterium]
MPVTPAQFRRMALAFPETAESTHQNHPDFRVRGKIFATLGYPDKKYGMVKLTPDQQEIFVADEPSVYIPAKGAWGRQGSTTVLLKAAKQSTLRRAVLAAWLNAAPKPLAQKFEVGH